MTISTSPKSEATPFASNSLHDAFFKSTLPEWLTKATPQQREALKAAPVTLPDGYLRASAAQRKPVHDSITASATAQARLAEAISTFKEIDAFAKPLLVTALKDQFNVELEVDSTYIRLLQPLEIGIFGIDVSSFEVLKLPLLDAALHNFEASECEVGAFHAASGFMVEHAGELVPLATSLTVPQFTGLCRSLDIGAQYQTYLKNFFKPADAVALAALREPFIDAHKTALRAAAEMALLNKDILPQDHRMILSVINGELTPSVDGRPVWFRDLTLMGHRMIGCIVFVISDKYRYTDDSIIYIPNDPYHPLKRYTDAERIALFKKRLVTPDPTPSAGDLPTQDQRFFSQFVTYTERPNYFGRFTKDAPSGSFSEALKPYGSIINDLVRGAFTFAGFKKLPPAAPRPQVPLRDIDPAPGGVARKGHGMWAANVDLWAYLFDQHRDKLLDDARAHAVPTAQVDAQVRSRKFSALLNIGLLLLTGVSMLVPGLGEAMLVLMGAQLLYTAFEGAIEWSEGDRKAAKAHLVDVAENLVLIGVMAGAGKGFGKLLAVPAEPVVEGLHPVVLPNGETRLWKPDLKGYESDVSLAADARPDPLGRYEVDGKTYIRRDGKVYQISQDTASNAWRIQHPSKPEAYQPLLRHNGQGAWRHTLERPLTWDRLTLLRRLGHATEPYSDEQLLKIADISGISDNTLRKVHLDNQPLPADLANAIRLFDADQGVDAVIVQVQSGQAIDSRYLYCLPLITELPRWPRGRVLEVFDAPDLTGTPVRYGAERLAAGDPVKEPIRVNREEVLADGLPARILDALDEAEVNRLLGGEGARVREARPDEFRKQLSDFAQTRRSAIFERLYEGAQAQDPRVAQLRKASPGLSQAAANEILAHTPEETLARLESTGTVPLAMREEAHWYARQERQTRAFAGLYSEHVATTDTKRLALHALQQLPGWSDTVRLEIRRDSIDGALIDAIGDESSTVRKYLVKDGPTYQAFNERGEPLNSRPRYGDNFYASVLHALPDEARQALGIPHVGQQAQLREAIIRSAKEHARLAPQWIEQAPLRPMPPSRARTHQIGYAFSGRGRGLAPSLESRARDVYHGLTPKKAKAFIRRLKAAGKTDNQIYDLLQQRRREWEDLEATLERWVNEGSVDRRATADALKRCWQNGPLAENNKAFTYFYLPADGPLPFIAIDFPHVRKLSAWHLTVEQLSNLFPNLENLKISVREEHAGDLLLKLKQTPKINHLELSVKLTPQVLNGLGDLTHLVELKVNDDGYGSQMQPTLDVSPLRQLRRLEINSPRMLFWPTGVFQLPRLTRLNLYRTGIRTAPSELLTSSNRFVKALSLDWRKYPLDQFRLAYNNFISRPHIVDLESMVQDFCTGELDRMSHETGYHNSNEISRNFATQWSTHQARFQAIEALSEQYNTLSTYLEAWSQADAGPPVSMKTQTMNSLKGLWGAGALERYSQNQLQSTPRVRHLTLRDLPATALPDLPANNFNHVTDVRLSGLNNLRAPIEQVRGFIAAFPQLNILQLDNCNLAEMPFSAQQQRGLQHLSLKNNPLTTADVTGLSDLRSLNLGGTHLEQLPTGVETLEQLHSLDLRNTRITTLPQALLDREALLFDIKVEGAPLSSTSEAALDAARAQVEQNRSLPANSLKRLADGVQDHFPPSESIASVVGRSLLKLPIPETAPGSAPLTQRLQRLLPPLETPSVDQWLERMRGEGLSDLQIHARIDGWNLTQETLIHQLNAWFMARIPSADIDLLPAAFNHSRVIENILQCWRRGLMADSAGQTLTLTGLRVGDLPTLTGDFSHVRNLDLSGVMITASGANGFLDSFSGLHSLLLVDNGLQRLPMALERMRDLRDLDLAYNLFHDEQTLHSTLSELRHLQQLNLNNNALTSYGIDSTSPLRILNLRSNRLTDWPQGTLESSRLRQLDIGSNLITSIPLEALDGSHDNLMAGTDISNTPTLSEQSLSALLAYGDRTGSARALGMTRHELAVALRLELPHIAGVDQVAPVPSTDSRLLAPWISELGALQQDRFREMWAQLLAEPDNAEFFDLLKSLQNTDEFRYARVDLAQQVRTVLEAAAGNTELRQTLFGLSASHGTCGDGRLLTFSGLRVKVYEQQTLMSIDPTRLDLKGDALLKLSRQLYRLDKTEELAMAFIKQASGMVDQAEVRLRYRIGLRAGWKDKLLLPGQPTRMMYDRPISGETLVKARQWILEQEHSDVFYENLITRDYWLDYLGQKYPVELETLESEADRKHQALEDAHETMDEDYQKAVNMLEIDRQTERNLKLLDLSRREVAELTPPGDDSPQPGPSRNMTGDRAP